ncbi:MAG: hypothetical protein IJT94_10945 [Oscillibacter sp.]|nr:hypothetical protein [Oscillibacter sp.]
MSEPLRVQTLIRRFEEKLRRMDDDRRDRPAGNGPRFPMLTVCLGREAEAVRRNLSDRLFHLWPQYRRELRFLRAETDCGADDLLDREAYYLPDREADSTPGQTRVRCFDGDGSSLDEEGLRAAVSDLFGIETHFADYDTLLLCVAIDTSGVTDGAGLGRLLDAASALQRETRADNVRTLWAVLLDEGHGRERIGEELRRELARQMDAGDLPAVLLLSNRRSDGRLDAGWDHCCHAAADAFAVSNSELGGDLFREGAYTAAWRREEKPYGAISQICVCALLDQFPIQVELPEEEELRRRLDLSREYTFQFIDGEDRSGYLPQPFQLELFPLPAPRRAEWTDPQTTAREFDQRTFGAWSCWLDHTYETIAENAPEPSRRGREYEALLRERFSMGELAALGERRDAVERWFRSAKPPTGDLPLLAYAESVWKYRASTDPETVSALLDALGQLMEEGRAFVADWRAVEQSQAALYRVEDEDLTRFYRDLLRDYFDGCGDTLRQAFRKLGGREDLEAFLDLAMEDLLRDGRMRNLASFGDELAVRLKTASKSAEASREILRKLSGDALPVYFTAKFNLGHPVRSFLLTRTKGPLYEDLRAELPEDTCFYDTGGAAAEALTLYRVARGQLL